MKKTNAMSKRDFIRHCAFGACVLFSGGRLNVLSGKNHAPFQDIRNYWKWSVEAKYYEKISSGFKCLKCPNGCVIQNNDTGLCRNRIVFNNKMYSVAYGNPCSVHIDPIEKKPFYHFLPSAKAYSIAAAGCNLSCLNCQNWQISQFSPRETSNYDLMPASVVEQAKQYSCETVAYTYSEPITFYEYVYDTAVLARKSNIRNLFKSNGYICEEPLRELAGVIDAANIDLKSYDDDVYRRLSGGSLAPVLKTLTILKEKNVWLEITNLIIPGWTDDMTKIRDMCRWLKSSGLADCPLHFSRFTPLHKLNQLPSTPVATLEKARGIALSEGIQYVYIGNVPAHDSENTFCHGCGKKVIERRGFSILNNFLDKGCCRFCSVRVPGVWQ